MRSISGGGLPSLSSTPDLVIFFFFKISFLQSVHAPPVVMRCGRWQLLACDLVDATSTVRLVVWAIT